MLRDGDTPGMGASSRSPSKVTRSFQGRLWSSGGHDATNDYAAVRAALQRQSLDAARGA